MDFGNVRLHTRLGALLTSAVIGLTACGGGGGGGDSGTTAVSAGGTTVAISTTDASTFMIGLTKETRAGVRSTFILGTGFAIGPNQIATNAHVTKGVLDVARQLAAVNEKIVAVTAFQSETGKAYPLLTAIVHPSYSGDTRSPDVGLFITRDALTSTLQLDDPPATTRLRKGDPLTLNGFPGTVFQSLYSNFQPGQTVPKSTLFTCNIQTIENFDPRVVVDPTNLSTIEMYQHGCDTEGGVSGSPMINGGKVFALHNSGLQYRVVTGTGQTQQFEIVPSAVGSWGVHVKHLHNLIALNTSGVLEADKRFSLPPSDALVGAQGGGQSTALTGSGAVLRGDVNSVPPSAEAAHQIQFSVAQDLTVKGTAVWPRIAGRNWSTFTFSLSGKVKPNGEIEVVDNADAAGLTQGVYRGFYNSITRGYAGQYYEYNATRNEFTYFGEWSVKQ